MGRSALIVFFCAGTAGAQIIASHPPKLFAFCQQAATNATRNDGVVPPVALTQCRQPEYTAEARLAHLAGVVTMSLTVDDDGIPNEIHVVSPLGLGLDENAVACVRQSRYSPAEKDGKPVPLKMTVSLPFQEPWESDWHLGAAAFQTAYGVARPVLVNAKYPGATGDRRNLTVCVHLTIGKDGAPRDLRVPSPPDPHLAKEAIELLAAWRFRPGTLNQEPVDVPAVLTLVHGAPARTLVSNHHR
jgi:TonB family protein